MGYRALVGLHTGYVWIAKLREREGWGGGSGAAAAAAGRPPGADPVRLHQPPDPPDGPSTRRRLC